MNKQGLQMAIEAIQKVINSVPKPYSSTLSNTNYAYSDISPQQFVNWINYLYSILDISYQNLGSYDFMMVKNNIMKIVYQSDPTNPYAQYKIPYSQLVNRINDELLNFVQYLIRY